MTKSFYHILLVVLTVLPGIGIKAQESVPDVDGSLTPVAYPKFLIPQGNVQTSTGVWISKATGTGSVSALLDGYPGTWWFSDNTTASEKYLEVTLGDDITQGLDENEHYDLVIYVKRHNRDRKEHPTTFHVTYSTTDNPDKFIDEYSPNGLPAFAFFFYRGRETDEYSGRIHLGTPEGIKEKKIAKLKFKVQTSNSRTRVKGTEYLTMGMAEFNLMLVGHNQKYSSMLDDRLHLATDYYHDYKNFDFENTLGIIDPTNSVEGWQMEGERWRKYKTANGADTVVWTFSDAEKARMEAAGIKMPNFTPISSANSKDVLPGKGFRQPTHTVEHILYAIPGDAITLYPYYDMYVNPYNPKETFHYYGEVFSHWYDFTTGGHLTTKDEMKEDFNVLDFLIDPSGIQKTDRHGFVGGPKLTHTYMATVEATTVQDVMDFAHRVNSGERKLNLRLAEDLDFSGVTDFPPIGTENYPFMGIIDGNGHTIKNLVINSSNDDNIGFIGYAGGDAQLLNIRFDEGCRFIGHNHVGLVGAYKGSVSNRLTIKGVSSDATIEAVSKNPYSNSGGGINAGGLLGSNVSESYQASGGLVITNCYVGGKIKGFDESGVITGWAGRDVNGSSAIKSISNVICTAELDYEGFDELFARHAFGTKVTVTNCHAYEKHWNHFAGLVRQIPTKDDVRIVKDDQGKEHEVKVGTISDYDNIIEKYNANLEEGKDPWKIENDKIYAPCSAERSQSVVGKTVYELATAEDLKGFRDLVNTGTGTINGEEVTATAPFYANLTADISFADTDEVFTPIGINGHPFSGSINGNGHTISNINIGKVTGISNSYYGFIGLCEKDVELINIKFDEKCSISGGSGTGIIGRYGTGGNSNTIHIEGVTTYATVSGSANTAGLLGVNATSAGLLINDCMIGGSITGTTESAAVTGWVGNNNATTKTVERVVSIASLTHRSGQDKTFIRFRTQQQKGTGNNYVNVTVKDCYFSQSNPYPAGLKEITDDDDINSEDWIQNNIRIDANSERAKELQGYIDFYNETTKPDDDKRIRDIEDIIDSNTEIINRQIESIENLNTQLAELEDKKESSISLEWSLDKNGNIIPPVFSSDINESECTVIQDAADLINFAYSVNNGLISGDKLNAILSDDIDMSVVDETRLIDKDYEFKGIGKWETYKYIGSFDGKGHTIKNLNISATENGVGFISYAGGNTSLYNLIFDNTCTIEGGKYTGIVGVYRSDVTDSLTIKGVVNHATMEGGENTGAFLGANLGKSVSNGTYLDDAGGFMISNCLFDGSLKTGITSGIVAGWAGKAPSSNPPAKRVENVVLNGTYSVSTSYPHKLIANNSDYPENRIGFTYKNVYSNLSQLESDKVTELPTDVTNQKLAHLMSLTDALWSLDFNGNPQPPVADDNTNIVTDLTVHIKNADELITFSREYAKTDGIYAGKTVNVVLDDDIDMNSKTVVEGFTPIGNDSRIFTGVFDGAGHKISNLIYEIEDRSNIGFIGFAKDAVLKNLVFDGSCKITSLKDNVGIIGHVQDNATVLNIRVEEGAQISGNSYVGVVGLYDLKQGSNAADCMLSIKSVVNNGIVTASSINAGGILGCNKPEPAGGVTIENCAVTGTVKGGNQSGVITGWIGKKDVAKKVVKNAYSTAEVSGIDGNNFVRSSGVIVDMENCYMSGYNQNNKSKTDIEYLPIPKDNLELFQLLSTSENIPAQIANLEAQIETAKQKIATSRSEIATAQERKKTILAEKEAHDAYIEEVILELEEIVSAANWSEGDSHPVPPVSVVTLPAMVTDDCERKYGSVATFYYPRNVNEADGKLHGFFDLDAFPKLADEKTSRGEFVIAADFSQSFDPEKNITKVEYDGDGIMTGGTFVEPVIQFRHIFRIRDGKTFAENFSGSPEKNKNYVEKNLRHVTARAGADFQVRFDSPVPVDGSGIEPVRSKYYYKIDDFDYRRVCSMNVRVTLINDETTGEDVEVYYGTLNKNEKDASQIFYATGAFDGQGSRVVDGVEYFVGGGGAQYNRFLACDAKDTQEGRYRVELIGLDYNGEVIKVYDPDTKTQSGEDLVVQQFIIEFVGDEAASLVVDSELYDSNYSYFKHAREEELEEEYGEPLGKITYDYDIFEEEGVESDLYRIHEDKRTANITRLHISQKDITKDFPNDGKSTIQSNTVDKPYYNVKRLKWPVAWNQSGYSFGYNEVYDYNTYIIASHASMARFRDAACGAAGYTVGDNTGAIYADDQGNVSTQDGDTTGGSVSVDNSEPINDGLYDRLYYDSRIKYPNDPDKWESGYFWYVNASNDPGVMARLNLKEFCAGSTITVSAWVAECSNHKEVANLAFNFVAVKTDGDRIPIHSFVTGYVTQRNTLQTNSKGEVVKDRAGNVTSTIVDTPPAILGTQNAGFAGRHVGWPLGHWMNVYYSFVPNLIENGITEAEVDHYELELDNNCKSSEGADYAVDNIRMYVSVPRVYADQLSPVCDPTDRRAEVKVHAPFDMLLQAFGLEENMDIPRVSTNSIEGSELPSAQGLAKSLLSRAGEEAGAGDNLTADRQGDNKTVTLYYTFLDKEIYDKALADGKEIKEAFEAAVVKYNYDGNESRSFGRVTFNTEYSSNKAYTQATDGDGRICYRQRIDGVRQLAFNTTPAGDDKLKVGHDFYIAFWVPADYVSENENPGASEFDITYKCSKYGVFRLKGSTDVKIDGINVPSNSEFEGCHNQQPVVQIAVQGLDEKKEMVTIDENAYCDWFAGTRAEYDAYEEDVAYTKTEDVKNEDGTLGDTQVSEEVEEKVSLVTALAHFRSVYPDADDCDGLVAKGNLKEGEMELIRKLSTSGEVGTQARLVLHKSSYTFPPIQFEYETDENGNYKYDEDGSKIVKENSQAHVVAIPITSELKEHPEGYIVCTEPSQIDINVKKSSPDLLHGIPGIEYPTELKDVPLRVGLDQLKSVSTDLTVADATNGKDWLDVPVRMVSPTSRYVTYFRYADDRGIYLVQTDDPAYKDLDPYLVSDTRSGDSSEIDGSGATRADDGIATNSDDNPFEPVGELVYLRSRVQPSKEDYAKADNFMGIVFDKRFKFHEGYTYRFRFGFEEAHDRRDSSGDIVAADDVVGDMEGTCPGQHIFTLKVVPEYQKWTGAVNADWNNDGNWSRVTSSDLKRSASDNKLKSQKYQETEDVSASGDVKNKKGYVDEGENGWTLQTRTKDDYVADYRADQKASFAPLDFTKVILDPKNYKGMKHPHLFAVTEENKKREVKLFHHKNDAGYESGTSDFTLLLPDADDYDAAGVSAGEMTKWIEYDMAARYFTGGVGVRPWMSQTCRDVHFAPGSEILNQQWLTYERAWVEMEVKPTRWYTLASPMKSTIAGDMYLPTAGAREESQLFLPITFDTNLHNRFDPAVFQRGWNKSKAMVYELPGATGGAGAQENVAVSLAWSNVYNEVKETYGSGTGFSIKTDVSRINERRGAGNEVEKVLFRLPKHDAFYEYYEDKNGGIKGDKTDNLRTERYKLNLDGGAENGTITVTSESQGSDCGYYLVGNPFMAHLDMKKFLEENSEKIDPVFWIVTSGKNNVGYVKEEVVINAGSTKGDEEKTDVSETLIPPFQGFFVKRIGSATRAGQELTLKYTTDMIRVVDPKAGEISSFPVRSSKSASHSPLTLTAVSKAGKSVAVVNVAGDVAEGYDGADDAAMLLDREMTGIPMVYTLAGNMAATINSVPSAEGIEIGVDATDDETETELTLSNTMMVEGMYLFDKENDSLTEIEEGMTLTVKGSSRGRYFIVSGRENPEDEISTLRIDVAGNMVTVSAGGDDAPVEVNVYDVAGRTVLSATDLGRVEFDLDRGAVYIIEAASGEERTSRKLAL